MPAGVFGILRPCRHRLSGDLRREWMGHLCGLCLALRDEHGHLARLATNTDGLVVSVLLEAQTGPRRRQAGPCALRGLRPASVATGDGARLAAAVSLALAAAKTSDHVADGDGALARRPLAAAARRVARSWSRAAAASGAGVGFDTAALASAAARQRALEEAAGPGTPLTVITEPSETAAALAFAHTAVLAGRPANTEPLRRAGAAFGRVAHLVDAVEDLEADRRTGAWNPLLATGAGPADARRLCDRAAADLRDALAEATFADDRLAHALLAHEVVHTIQRTFATGRTTYPSPPPVREREREREPVSGQRPPDPPAERPSGDRRPDRNGGGSDCWCDDNPCCWACDCADGCDVCGARHCCPSLP